MACNEVPDMNFKGYMADTAYANWNAIKTLYGEGDIGMPMVGRERTYHFHFAKLR